MPSLCPELCEEDTCSGKMNTECVDTAQGPICVCLRGYMSGLESQCVGESHVMQATHSKGDIIIIYRMHWEDL